MIEFPRQWETHPSHWSWQITNRIIYWNEHTRITILTIPWWRFPCRAEQSKAGRRLTVAAATNTSYSCSIRNRENPGMPLPSSCSNSNCLNSQLFILMWVQLDGRLDTGTEGSIGVCTCAIAHFLYRFFRSFIPSTCLPQLLPFSIPSLLFRPFCDQCCNFTR